MAQERAEFREKSAKTTEKLNKKLREQGVEDLDEWHQEANSKFLSVIWDHIEIVIFFFVVCFCTEWVFIAMGASYAAYSYYQYILKKASKIDEQDGLTGLKHAKTKGMKYYSKRRWTLKILLYAMFLAIYFS